jgi:hypothetical protein
MAAEKEERDEYKSEQHSSALTLNRALVGSNNHLPQRTRSPAYVGPMKGGGERERIRVKERERV